MPDDNAHDLPPQQPATGGGGDDPRDEVARDVLRYLAGELSKDEVAALGQRLRADAASREMFVRVCLLESWLTEKFAPGRREFLAQMMLEESEEHGITTSIDAVSMPAILAADAGEDAEPEMLVVPSWPKPPAPPTPWWKRRAAWAAAAVLVVGVGVWALVATIVGPDKPLVATLSGAQEVRWTSSSPAPAVGSPLRASSELRLQSGLVRLTFNGGAKVVVEGPAKFAPEAEGRLRLVSGRMTALVPPAARGFTVRTPTAEVVDLGTEFGVDVPPTRGAPVEVQVFDGVVTLQPAAAAERTESTAPAPPPQVLKAGTGARVDPAGTITHVPVNPAMFVRAAEADAIERASKSNGFDRWAAYRYQLARDPDVVAYYPFDAENKDRSPERLTNASGTGPGLDGTLAGDGGAKPRWVAGRWPEKAALAFGEPGIPRVTFPGGDGPLDFSRGPAAGEGQAFTIALWVKAKPKPSPGVGLVARGIRGAEQFAIETESTFYRFAVRDAVAADQRGLLNSRNYVSAFWHHVAATYEPATNAMRLYVDGVAVNDDAPGAGIAPKMLRPADGPVVLGCRVMSPGVFGMPLDGTVDELVFIRRAITPGEVRQMYEAGKPD
jgi:hypothetical protein